MRRTKGIICALASSATFGLIGMFSLPLLEAGMSSMSVLFYRFLLSAMIMGIFCIIGGKSLRIPLKYIPATFLLAVMYASTSMMLLYSYQYIPTGTAVTIHFLYPIVVSMIMVTVFKERGSALIFLAALMSLLGVMLMSRPGQGGINFTGIYIALTTTLTYSLYIIGVNKTKAGQNVNASMFTFYVLLFSAVVFGAAALIADGGFGTIPDTRSFVYLVVLALFCTVISDLTLVYAIKFVGSTVSALLGSMEPLVAVLVGVLHFSEPFDMYSLSGILLILVSVSMVVLKDVKKDDAAPQKGTSGRSSGQTEISLTRRVEVWWWIRKHPSLRQKA